MCREFGGAAIEIVTSCEPCVASSKDTPAPVRTRYQSGTLREGHVWGSLDDADDRSRETHTSRHNVVTHDHRPALMNPLSCETHNIC